MKKEEIDTNGFNLYDHENHELDMALLSLKIGLVAYFSTYKMVQSFFISIDENHQMVRERIRDSGYIHEYFETIFHFHHFIEVSVKAILRDDHELSESKLSRFNTKSAMKHLEKLKGKKNYENMDFISFDRIEAFNRLRNRLAHRGIFILDYKYLDKLIGEDILPFIKKLLDLPIYKNHEFRWQPKDLYCRIDPIQEIISECQTQDINFRKIAIFKQLALAAYANPIEAPRKGNALSFSGPSKQEEAEERAKKERDNPVDLPVDDDIKICPVCGAESLVRFLDSTPEYNSSWFIHSIYCFCCHFDLDSFNLKDVSVNSLNTEEFWQLS